MSIRVYSTEYGEVQMPLDLPNFRKRKDGQPDRRTKSGRTVDMYFRHILLLAKEAYGCGGDLLRRAPSFSTFTGEAQ
jgi:hypothetical protein